MSTYLGPRSVSLLIPAYNEEGNLGTLLDFLRELPALSGRSVETILDISGSTDKTPEIARSAAAGWSAVRIIDSGRRDGLLRAIQRLLASARGDILVRLDSDIKLAPDTLGRLLARLDAGARIIIGPRIVPASTGNTLVDRYSRAEWEVHHRVSLRAPKTTLVQAFRRVPIALPSNSGVEDSALQEQAAAFGLAAEYDAEAVAVVMPPPTIAGVLSQRIRTIFHLKRHRINGFPGPSTASLSYVVPAVIDALRQSNISLADLLVFVVVEGVARLLATARAGSLSATHFLWEPLLETKRHNWAENPVSRIVLADRAPPADRS